MVDSGDQSIFVTTARWLNASHSGVKRCQEVKRKVFTGVQGTFYSIDFVQQ